MRPIFNLKHLYSAFIKIGIATTILFCSVSLANAAGSSVAREGDAALIKKDYVTALSKYTILAEEGNVAAQFNVGVLYLKGQGSPKDEQKAFAWFKKSALGGYANAKIYIEATAARGNVYAIDALKALQTEAVVEAPIESLPPKVKTPLAVTPPQTPTPPVIAEKPSEPKTTSETHVVLNKQSADTAVQNMYVVFDVGTVSIKSLGAGGSNPSYSYRIAGGYKILPVVAAEIGYLKTGTGSYSSAAQSSIYVSSIQVSAVFNYPVLSNVDLLGRLGFTSNTSGGDAVTGCNCTSSRTLLYGLGAQYNLTKNFGARLEYTNYGNVTHDATGGDLAMSSISLGLLYNF